MMHFWGDGNCHGECKFIWWIWEDCNGKFRM